MDTGSQSMIVCLMDFDGEKGRINTKVRSHISNSIMPQSSPCRAKRYGGGSEKEGGG